MAKIDVKDIGINSALRTDTLNFHIYPKTGSVDVLPEKLKFVKVLELKALNIKRFSSILGAVATSKRLAHTLF